MDKLASAVCKFQLRLAGILMDTWILFLFVAIAGITPGYLKTLLNAFGHVETVCSRALLERWQGIVLPEPSLYRILIVGEFTTCCEWNFYKFLAIACGFLGKNLFETMIYVCELLTEEPEGGSAMIPLRTFLRLYGYLAELDCSGECPREGKPEDTEEFFRPCGPPSVSDASSSAVDSCLYREPSAMEEEDSGPDVCGPSSSESRSSENLEVIKDYGIDARLSEIDEVHQLPPAQGIEIETQPVDDRERRTNERSEASGTTILEVLRTSDQDQAVDHDSAVEFQPDDKEDSIYDMVHSSSLDFGGEEAEGETASLDQTDDYEPIGLESILHGICECLEPAREAERAPTPPPDPLEQFHERMKNEVEEGRLQTLFHVPGIGPPVSVNRITAVGLWLAECGRRQEGLVGPRNIRHFLCPDLDDHCDNEDQH